MVVLAAIFFNPALLGLSTFAADPVSGKPIQVKAGRYGPYVTDGVTNASLRKDMAPETITFEQAAGLIDYLDDLGITDVYASPFLMSRPGSVHGYDVTDHSRFIPEIGDENSFLGCVATSARAAGSLR